MTAAGPRVPFNETINLADSDSETRPRSASAAVPAPLPSFLSKKSVSAWAPPADAVRRPQAMGARSASNTFDLTQARKPTPMLSGYAWRLQGSQLY